MVRWDWRILFTFSLPFHALVEGREGQFCEEEDDHDVERDKQDEMNEKDGELIDLLNFSEFGFSFFVVP